MSTRLRALIVLGACAMLVTAFGSTAFGSSNKNATAAASGKIKVTLLTKSTGGFWDAMIAGAKKYAASHPEIALTTNACKTNDDTPCQIAQIQDAVTKGAKAIVISPMGVGVTAALNKAKKAGVRIVFVDNTIPGVVPTAVAATNNVKGGLAAGAYIKTRLKSGDTIGLLEAVRGVPNLDQRIDGVKKALAGTGVKVVIGAQQTLCDTKTGATVTQDLLTRYPDLTAVYSACDSPAIGAVSVAESKQKPLKIFGYDGDPEMAKLILAGKTTATMAQSPFRMTYLGVQAAVKSLKGQKYVKRIDTGVTLVTKANAAKFTKAWQ
jgi:ABC-type sugar transport system substrate-binding protein